MARTRETLPEKIDVAHLISTGVLASVCPRVLFDEVLAQTGKASQHVRLLPAPAVVYYVMVLALWRDAPFEEVRRGVCEGLQWLSGGECGVVQASKSAISQARTRLGPQVMKQLADRVLRPMTRPDATGVWYRGWRLMAADGSCMDVPTKRPTPRSSAIRAHRAARARSRKRACSAWSIAARTPCWPRASRPTA